MSFNLNCPELYVNRVFRRTTGVYEGDLFILVSVSDGHRLLDVKDYTSSWTFDGKKPFGSFFPSCTYWELMPELENTKEDNRELI